MYSKLLYLTIMFVCVCVCNLCVIYVFLGCVTTADGSALVKLGNTTVMCGIKAELCKPKTETPKCGYIVPNVELSPLCAPHFRPGPPGEQAQVMSQFMLDILNNSRCIDMESLCISAGKLVWVLYCDLVCLDYDGNVTDACVLALLAALKNVYLPEVKMNEETDSPETDMTHTTPLLITTQPVSSTYAIFDDNVLLVDPTAEEENLATGIVTIVTNNDQICSVHKPGGSPLRPEQLIDCFTRSFDRSREICRLIDETINSVDR